MANKHVCQGELAREEKSFRMRIESDSEVQRLGLKIDLMLASVETWNREATPAETYTNQRLTH